MERAIRLLLTMILFFPFVGVKANAYTVRKDLRSFQVPSLEVPMKGSALNHPDASGIEYTFLPPEKEKTLYITLSPTDQISVRLVFSSGTKELRLPSSPGRMVVGLVPPLDSLLYSVSFSGNPDFYTGSEGSVTSAATVSLDRPEILSINMGKEAGDAPQLMMRISGNGQVLFHPYQDQSGDDPFSIMLFSTLRSYEFPTGEYKSSVWNLAPLENIDVLSFQSVQTPEFPSALLRDGGQILENPPDRWRNKDFEVYSWTPLPEILVFDCLNYDIQNRFFRRLAYFVEKKGFSGTLLTNGQLKDKHGWNAHDYRPSDLADFFNLVEKLNFKVYPEEDMLLQILLKQHILRRDSRGKLMPGGGAVISISRESTEVLRKRFLTHEASHGLYFTSGEYRTFVRKTWDSLEDEDRKMWRFFLGWYGYNPKNEDLMMNEFQAYLVQQKPEEAPLYFSPRLAGLAVKYPVQKKLLNRRTGQSSVIFRDWAEQLGSWIDEKWGLEAGNFSTLRKELH